MFPENVQKRLDLLNPMLIEVSKECIHIVEATSGGAADLTVNLQNSSILFKNLENKKLQYFKNAKCADCVLFEYSGTHWITHIFECKRSVGKGEWVSIKQQFCGALQNAYALAGILDIEIKKKNIRVYTVYRNDKLNDYANPAKSRMQMHKAYSEKSGELLDAKREWNAANVSLDVAGIYDYPHKKIKLDVQTGFAEYELV